MRLMLFGALILVGCLYGQKIEITADRFTTRDANKVVKFVGNAKIQQGPSSIKASKIILYFNNDNSIKKYEAIDDVIFIIKKEKIDYSGRCKTMSYDFNRSLYILEGNVAVRDTNNTEIFANRIEINSKTETFVMVGSKKRAAKLILEVE